MQLAVTSRAKYYKKCQVSMSMHGKRSILIFVCLLPERLRDQQVEPPDGDPVRPEAGPVDVEVDWGHEVLGRRRDRQKGDGEGRQDFAKVKTCRSSPCNSPKMVLLNETYSTEI